MTALLVFAVSFAPSTPDSAEVSSGALQPTDGRVEVVPPVANGVVSLATTDFDFSHLAPSSFGDWEESARD